MTSPHALAVAALVLSAFASAQPLRADAACCAAEPAAPAPAAASLAAPAGHPLRGVVVAVLPEKSALLVKHEEIPGVMSAMTMLLKVDDAALASAKQDAAITATLVKKADGWWLENIAPAPAAPSSP